MFFGLNFSDLLGGAQPTTSTADGLFSFDGAPTVNAGCSNCTSFIYGQNNSPITFTNLAASGSFTMNAPYQVNSISVSYQVSDAAVPEPGAWALMILGFGGAGAMLRRRRFAAA
jgi:hypothetical protein